MAPLMLVRVPVPNCMVSASPVTSSATRDRGGQRSKSSAPATQITEASTVILNLTLENNKPDFSVTVRGAPAIQIQEAKTVLLVNDGDTAGVGGVYSTSESTGATTTPFFAKIPILGYLFQERSRTQENQELMLFITPHITKG